MGMSAISNVLADALGNKIGRFNTETSENKLL